MNENKKYRSLFWGDLILLGYWLILITLSFQAAVHTSFWLLPLWIFLILCLMAFILPNPKAGAHKLGSRNMVYWYLHFQFARVWNFPPIKHVLFSFVVLRTLFLRCCGAQIAWTVGASNFLQISDPFMISIDRNVTIGIDVLIAGHTFSGDRLFLMPVQIESDVMIGAKCSLSPGSKIKKGAQVDRYCQILPRAVVPEGAHIGHNSVISSECVLQPGEVTGPFLRPKSEQV